MRGNQLAGNFADAYTQRTGRAAQPYFYVKDIVGLLPPPRREGLFTSPPELRHLEDRLHAVLPRRRG